MGLLDRATGAKFLLVIFVPLETPLHNMRSHSCVCVLDLVHSVGQVCAVAEWVEPKQLVLAMHQDLVNWIRGYIQVAVCTCPLAVAAAPTHLL